MSNIRRIIVLSSIAAAALTAAVMPEQADVVATAAIGTSDFAPALIWDWDFIPVTPVEDSNDHTVTV